MTILEYYEGLYEAKHAVTAKDTAKREHTFSVFDYGGYVAVSRHKKGAGKGYKTEYEWRWTDRKGYCEALQRNSPVEYGLMLCRIEHNGITDDKWWDTPSYRKIAIKDYRSRIAAIRKKYGLSYDSVKKFYDI